MSEQALASVEVNTLASPPSSEATPQKPLPSFKRKQLEDEYTPRSRHVDKKGPSGASLQGAEKPRKTAGESTRGETESEGQAAASASAQPEDVFSVVEETGFDGSTSVGSILSQPDFSASVRRVAGDLTSSDRVVEEEEEDTDPEVEYYKTDEDQVVASPSSTTSPTRSSIDAFPEEKTPVPTTRVDHSSNSIRQISPSRTPRLRDFQMPLTTPRDIVESAIRGHHTALKSVSKSSAPKTPRFSEADLLSFQTPAPRRQTDPQSQLRRFTNEEGEEMLLDITPRVYSPHSIPIYTLRDLDQIKAEFDKVRAELDAKVAALHEELAVSVSNANHHKALAAQGESLHSEYSKKHVRKVTALKTDWERKTLAKIAQKDEVISARDETIRTLQEALSLEREEKKEVIQMAEAVLALQQEQQ